MRVTGVISRFLPLLDVVLLLLGLLMVVMMQASFTEKEETNSSSESIESSSGLSFIFLYAGWKDSEAGKCYLLEKNMAKGKEINTDTKQDIDQLITEFKRNGKGKNVVIFLAFSKAGWFDTWGEERIKEIEKKWEVKINRLNNVDGLR